MSFLITPTRVPVTFSVTIYFDSSVEHFTHRLYLDMITMGDVEAFTIYVRIEVFSHILRIIIAIGSLRTSVKYLRDTIISITEPRQSSEVYLLYNPCTVCEQYHAFLDHRRLDLIPLETNKLRLLSCISR